MPAGHAITTVPLSLLDELYLNLDRQNEPWTVHYEVHVGSQMDPDRLRDAVAAAARQHPLARARLVPWRFQDRGYDWKIDDELHEVPLTIIECEDAAALERRREQFFSTSPSLTDAPPFAIALARCHDGDGLLLNLNHAAGDGISAKRLMLSILRAYAGEEDPVPALDPLRLHGTVDALAAARSAGERNARRRALMEGSWRPFVGIARVAREGDDDRPAYGFELLGLSKDESSRVFAGVPASTTVNDVLLGALALAIARWNADHGRLTGPIALSMPVNLRPAEWRQEIFSNFATWVTVWVRAEADEDLSSVAARVGVRTGIIKRDRLGGLAVDLLRMPGRLMVVAKRWLQYLKAFTNDVVVDTASLSNLGRLEPLPRSIDGGETAVWFSPPSQMPLGVAIGVVTVGDRLYVTMRYRHAQFDRNAARKFIELYRSVLVE
jgi:NRPS condensation-like uncharacterized protein